MRQIIITRSGGTDVLKITEQPDPTPAKGEAFRSGRSSIEGRPPRDGAERPRKGPKAKRREAERLGEPELARREKRRRLRRKRS